MLASCEARSGEALLEQTCAQILAPGLPRCVALGKLLGLSKPWALLLLNERENFKLKALVENKLK